MSIIGTGIAAGVANTAHQAQQTGRADSARSAAQSERAGQTDKLTLTQLHGTGATRDTDQDLPDSQTPGYDNLYDQGDGEHPEKQEDQESQADQDKEAPELTAADQIHLADAPVTSPTGIPLQPTYRQPHGLEAQVPLFRQIDVQG